MKNPINTQGALNIRFILNFSSLLVTLSLFLGLGGCASLGKGVTQALLENAESKDTRVCQVTGQEFDGIDVSLNKTQGITKILFVHGVGDHIPGYTTEFMEKLTKQLGLNLRSEGHKNIVLAPVEEDNEKNLGHLRVTRLMSEESGRELMFYELTWSEISREDKAMLNFDNSGEYNFRRARINGMLKTFMNDTAPDPIIYRGDKRNQILMAFGQSMCWMISRTWNDLPESGRHACKELDEASIDRFATDNLVFISHSLGSRIVIDGLERIAGIISDSDSIVAQEETGATLATEAKKRLMQEQLPKASTRFVDTLRNKHISIFMLSNQLPILQLGRPLPAVSGRKAEFCDPSGAHYAFRTLSSSSMVAFSDPNDLLSYPIPKEFSDKYLDSRLCPRITNININIAKILNGFGLTDLANPIEAHNGYDRDDRVISLIAHGIGRSNTSSLVKERCELVKMIED